MRNLIFIIPLFLIGCNKCRLLREGSEFPESCDYLVAGQSNGVSDYRGGNALRYSTSGKVWINDPHNNYDLKCYTPKNLASSSLTWLALGEKIVSLTGNDVRFLNISVGSTSIKEWKKGTLFEVLNKAIKESSPKYVIWVQGENDAKSNMTEDEYYADLKYLIDQTAPTPWYVCLTSKYDPSLSSPIRNAQKRIIAEGYAQEGADLDILRLDQSVQMVDGRIHLSGNGYDLFAEEWREKLF